MNKAIKTMIEFNFEKLVIWQKAMEYGETIYLLSFKFPKEEIYNLSSLIRRAVDYIALNISEGSISQRKLRTSANIVGYVRRCRRAKQALA